MLLSTCKISLKSPTPATPKSPATPATPSPSKKEAWCVPKPGVSDAQLQSNLDYACGQGIDCRPIQPGGPCFEPNTMASHAAYAMNLLYQSSPGNPWNCDFKQTATLTAKNPSTCFQTLELFFKTSCGLSEEVLNLFLPLLSGYNGCSYPGGSI